MKKIILLIAALMVSVSLFADTFTGIYGVHTKTITDTVGGEEYSDINIAFGQSMDGRIGLGYEAFFNNAGLGGAVEMFTTIGGVKVSLGKILVPENAYRSPINTWPVASSSDKGDGAYIGLSTKLKDNVHLNLKYMRFDTNHVFASSKCTANCGTKTAIFTNAIGIGSAEREQVWIGVAFHL